MYWLEVSIAALAAIGTLSSTIFLIMALMGARRFHAIAAQQRAFEATLSDAQLPFVSILKPLHGLEPQLKENLESFFTQDYPEYEVLLAVDTEEDAALAIAKSVMD
jgi:ceramide glucosyltransferase